MKIISTSFILSVLLTVSPSFSSGTNKHHGEKVLIDSSKRKKLVKKEKEEIVAVFKANEELHMAFFDFNALKIESKAQVVKKLMEKVSHKQLKKMLTFSVKKLGEMKATAPRDELNQNYNLVSMALIHLLKKYDIEGSYNAYYCPMKKKSWIQNSTKIAKVHNPYAGDMPYCGSQKTQF